jgi:hypothetical protein
MINEIVNEMLHQRNAANQHLLETLGITEDNTDAYEVCFNDECEIVKVLRVMKATIWEKKQNETSI